jgi:intracellular septation protein
MKFLFDLFPVLLFFLVFKFYSDWVAEGQTFCLASACIAGGHAGAIYAATATAILASFAQVGFFWLKHRRFETMHLITLALITVLGGATLLLHDDVFIKWKPTVVNWLFALVFLASQWFGSKPLIQRMMEHGIQLEPVSKWRVLNSAWAVFFIFMGALNLYVAFNFSQDTWVNFKLFGLMGLTLAFVFLQAFYLSRYIVAVEEKGQ